MESKILYQTYLHPQNEGANIENYIGFKHLTYLMEEAFINYFREKYLSPNILFKKYGIKLFIKCLNIAIAKAVNVDDEIRINITSLCSNKYLIKACDNIGNLFFKGEITIHVIFPCANFDLKLLPPQIEQLLIDILNNENENTYIKLLVNNNCPLNVLKEQYSTAFIYKKRIPYYYCNFTNELHHSGYERIIEEAVDLYLDNRHLSIKTMLDQKNWIPVVSKSSIEIKNTVKMEDTIYIVFTIKNVIFNSIYEAEIKIFKCINDGLIEVAVGYISHGYSLIKDPQKPELVFIDKQTLNALMYEKA